MTQGSNDERAAKYAEALRGHLFIGDASAYGAETCSCGWRRDGWDANTYEQHIAPLMVAVADAEQAELRAEVEHLLAAWRRADEEWRTA